MKKIVIPHRLYIDENSYEELKKVAKVYSDNPASRQDLYRRIDGAETITANFFDVDEQFLADNPSLKHIIIPAVGTDFIDLAAAKRKGVIISNCPTHNTEAVSEHALELILSLLRKQKLASQSIQAGEWLPYKFIGSELSGKTVCIFGYGRIGSRIGQLLAAFNCSVLPITSRTTEDNRLEYIKKSDVIIIAMPLSKRTAGYFNKQKIDLMKQNAILINVARGAIVDTKALYGALKKRKIKGAALDVFDNEPLNVKPDEIIVRLSQLSNVVSTPHIGHLTQEAQLKLGQELLETIKASSKKKYINVV